MPFSHAARARAAWPKRSFPAKACGGPQRGRSVEFNDETYGETRGMFVVEAETYGADKLWVVLKLIPIELDGEDGEEGAESG